MAQEEQADEDARRRAEADEHPAREPAPGGEEGAAEEEEEGREREGEEEVRRVAEESAGLWGCGPDAGHLEPAGEVCEDVAAEHIMGCAGDNRGVRARCRY